MNVIETVSTQLENKIKYLEKSEIDIYSLKDHKEFIKTNQLIKNPQQKT